MLSARFRPPSRSRAFRSERNCPPHTCLRAMRLRLLCFLREEGNPPFRAVPAAINIITRCNGSTAGSCFHKVKTAEAPFQSFLFVHKILFTAVLLMQNCKRTEDRIKCAKPSFTVRPSLEPSFLSPPFGIPDWSAERVLFSKVFMQVCLRTNDILQNFTFYRSRKELENVEFEETVVR